MDPVHVKQWDVMLSQASHEKGVVVVSDIVPDGHEATQFARYK